MPNLAKVFKNQTDRTMRQEKLGPAAAITITEDPGGSGPIVKDPNKAIAVHKTSADHDGRYYTKTESDALFARVERETFENVGTIVVEHNLGKRPIVQVIGQVPVAYGAGLYGAGAYGGIDDAANTILSPSSIVHDNLNQITVTLSAAATGEVVCVG